MSLSPSEASAALSDVERATNRSLAMLYLWESRRALPA